MTAGYCGRFAPSPTGPLHFGSLVAAVASYLQAKARHQIGIWNLRIDDIDPPREVAGSSQHIVETLQNHGFIWDAIQYQHSHAARYEKALDLLQAKGFIYGCDCSRKVLSQNRSTGLNSITGKIAVYPGNCRERNLPLEQRAVRFRVTHDIEFQDVIQGPQHQSLIKSVGDFIVKRRDGLYAYQLANVVDDGVDTVTEVVRGADLLDNTPRQIALAQALGYRLPEYMHVPVAVNHQGQKLSKQTRAAAINNHLPADNLYAAWQFLGQTRMQNLENLSHTATDQKKGIQTFWRQALQQWNSDKIPRVKMLEVQSDKQ